MTASWRLRATVLAIAAVLSACGGGSGDDGASASDSTPAPALLPVKVMVLGDSLADSGTFGYKFTVQGQDESGQPFALWSDVVAKKYEQTLCAHYIATSATTFQTNPSCNNFAVAGAQINPLDEQGKPVSSAISVLQQLRDASARGWDDKALVLMDGGANDAAALIEATLVALQSGDTQPFLKLVGSRVDAQTLSTLFGGHFSQAEALTKAGALYLELLANTLVLSIKAEVLDKSQARVAYMNVPPLTKTPLMREALANVKDAAKAEELAKLFDGWVQLFNGTVSALVKDDSRFAVADLYQLLNIHIANPSQYGYSNVALPACVLAGVDNSRLDLCTVDALRSNPPPGSTAPNWWQSYMFANAFHPTPFSHGYMGQLVQDTIDAKGWK